MNFGKLFCRAIASCEAADLKANNVNRNVRMINGDGNKMFAEVGALACSCAKVFCPKEV